ncbi:MAG: sulfatase-like hydrolase/transferase [Thermoleophilaceae bacterium]
MSVPAAASEGRRPPLKQSAWAFAHLAVLSTFAVAQPLFDLLRKNPEFFAARGSPGFDVISFSILMVVLPPLVLLALELLGGLAHPLVRFVLHLLFVTGLVALIAVQALKKSIDASDATLIALSVAIGALAAAAYAAAGAVRSFLNVLSPAPLVFLVIFLFFSPVSKLAFPSDAKARSVGGFSRSPVVVVLFDELPVSSLEDDHGGIDAKRLPAFAELAGDATWFRNAFTVYDSTERAQPAIFDGDLPAKDKLPTSADHPNSIFTLFAKSHRLNVSEEATSVCPRDLCKDAQGDESYGGRMGSLFDDLGLVWLHVVSPPGIERDLASVSDTWGDFSGGGGDGGGGDQGQHGSDSSVNTRGNLNKSRNHRFYDWVSKIRSGSRPALNFKHTLMPHVPWQYLPDGRQYHRTARDAIPQLSRQSYKDAYQIDSLHQRHLLQTGFADHELGVLLRRLKRTGLYDKSLIVVAADHGVAFDLGAFDRRTIKRRNAEEIGPIPFFLKAPGQRKGRVDRAYAESIDILPTILDVLNVNPRVHIDGASAFSRRVRHRRQIRILQRGTFKPMRFGLREWEAGRRRALQRKLSVFGTGAQGPLRLFRIGPDQQLLFQPVRDFRVVPGSGARFVGASEYRDVDLRSATIPVHVAGYLKGIPNGRTLAIAVNGRIAATCDSFTLATGIGPVFSAMTPESFWRQGRNRVELFEVLPGNALRRLGTA